MTLVDYRVYIVFFFIFMISYDSSNDERTYVFFHLSEQIVTCLHYLQLVLFHILCQSLYAMQRGVVVLKLTCFSSNH